MLEKDLLNDIKLFLIYKISVYTLVRAVVKQPELTSNYNF